MLSVIKTAIATIIISIISGLLLEYVKNVKNVAPKILCTVGKCVSLQMNGKKVFAYIVTVSNMSKNTVHELTLNIQSQRGSLNIADAKITKGLKFDSSIEYNTVDISMPFLSKGDKFSVTVYVETPNKPHIVLRSPENFKQVDSMDQKGVLASVFSMPKNVAETILGSKDEKGGTGTNRGLSKNKKVILAVASIALVILAAVAVKLSFQDDSPNKTQANSSKANTESKPANTTKPTGSTPTTSTGSNDSKSGSSVNSETNPSKSGSNKSTGTTSQSGGSGTGTDTKQSTGSGTNTKESGNSNSNTNTSSGTSTDTKTSTGETTGGSSTNSGTNTSGGTTNTNQDTKTSGSGTSSNSGSTTTTNGTDRKSVV